jgi:hypothetical protein
MSEDEKRSEDEVEGHRGPQHINSNEEHGDEVEAHRGPHHFSANDEEGDEVEGHMRRGV